MKSSHEIPLRLALAFGNLKTSRKKRSALIKDMEEWFK
jgi:hypothetical protein